MSAQPAYALVTGASAGIGADIARALAARGHPLILSARRRPELEALAAELTARHGVACVVLTADLAQPHAATALFEAVGERGLTVGVLVNNAGFGDLAPFAEADLPKMLRMIQVNVAALVELTGLLLPGMLARKQGRILNVGSVAGFQPGPLMAVYYATKAFVNSFSEALAHEVKGRGVSVTVLCPGPTRSEFAGVSGMDATELFSGGHVMDSRPVAEAGVKAMLAGRPLVLPGWRNKLLIFAERFLPRRLVVGSVHRMQARRHATATRTRGK